MKLCIEWLKEFVDIDISVEDLARRLTDQGVAVEKYEKVGNEYVLDLEITPNRPDQLSVFGIAREVKAMLGITYKKHIFESAQAETGGSPVAIRILDNADCPRYAGCLVENVTIGDSPNWMKKRLELSGIRALNNIVDITNYVLIETGHPLHAFDAACLEGMNIVVRRAQDGESIVTLDGVERALDSGVLVIADNEKPVAIAGIMGGEESEIKPHTKTIFIESAYFEPTLIRRGAKKLKITTESSYRFERGADIEAPVPALLRARDLIVELCKGTMKGGITDTYTGQSNAQKKVTFSIEWLNGFLGTDLSSREITGALNALDLEVAGNAPIEVTIPSFRRDLAIKEDIAEEVIRMVGFSRIPTNKNITFKKVASLPQSDMKMRTVRNYFLSSGFDEIINISFIAPQEMEALQMNLDPLPLQNPITSALTHLRSTLLPGLFSTVRRNLNIGTRQIRGFEMGTVFRKEQERNTIQESLRIAGVMLGNRKHVDWRGENRLYDYYDLKGIIEGLFECLRMDNLHFGMNEQPQLLEHGSTVFAGEEKAGFMGVLSKAIRDAVDIPKPLLLFEMDLALLLSRMSFDIRYRELPKYPAVLRDLCLLVPRSVTHRDIKEVIQQYSDGLVKHIELFDTYESREFEKGLKSFTYSLTFRSEKATLNDKVVNTAIANILGQLSGRLGITLRGEE
jgi:phenylalanyl-tRNA synthetase beta chain